MVKKGTTQFRTEFSEETWVQKYKDRDESDINDSHLRTALATAEPEKDKGKWAKEFVWAQENFKFMPGGRILSNAGINRKTTLINCFVDGAEGEDIDSINGIYTALQKQAQILKSEGGYGMSADFMRPHGAFILGIGNQSPGAVKFLELWDKSSEIITLGAEKKSDRKDQKGFIRKGAQMVTMSCWHPDILRFIEAKRTPGRLTKFNMSVLCTDIFMNAVVNKKPWKLVYPNYEKFPDDYKAKWNGDLQGWIKHIGDTYGSIAGAVVTYHKFDDANELWNIIMENTYNRNEPGVLFVDTMNRMNNLWWCEWINATNPCGEQVLPIGAVCLLGSINLVHFVKENGDFDFDLFGRVIHVAVRMLDNVNDVTYVPLQSQRDNLTNKRRIGLGVLGYASALMLMKLRYGSKKALKYTEAIMSFMTNEAYRASALLAKEKGPFPFYDKEKYLKSEFIKNLDPSVQYLIQEHGIRNSHLISLQPTGNSSCLANVTGGIEPNFAVPGYFRTAIQPHAPKGLKLPENIDWLNRLHKDPARPEDEAVWHWRQEGDEDLLRTDFNGKVWKYDRSRGLTKEEWIEDRAITILKERGEWDPQASWACSAMNLSVDDHVKTMAIFAKWADSAISKTINLPNDYPYKDFKRVYLEAWKAGVKGFTTYREGTMTAVLSTKSAKGIKKTSAPDRPEVLPCDIHHIKYKGAQWIIIIGVLDHDPYEVFAFKMNGYAIPEELTKGTLTKVVLKTKNRYELEAGEIAFRDVTKCFETGEEETITRMLSTSLRHGVDIEFLIDQLRKVKGNISSFNSVICRVLKTYLKNDTFKVLKCTECRSKNLEMREGCFACRDCGSSKCE
jgi:ribonucleoside-diphosphate reductase alpha chain